MTMHMSRDCKHNQKPFYFAFAAFYHMTQFQSLDDIAAICPEHSVENYESSFFHLLASPRVTPDEGISKMPAM